MYLKGKLSQPKGGLGAFVFHVKEPDAVAASSCALLGPLPSYETLARSCDSTSSPLVLQGRWRVPSAPVTVNGLHAGEADSIQESLLRWSFCSGLFVMIVELV